MVEPRISSEGGEFVALLTYIYIQVALVYDDNAKLRLNILSFLSTSCSVGDKFSFVHELSVRSRIALR